MSYHQQIYDRLRHDGLSEAGAIGMLGNWQAESNCEPNRVQGDFSPYRTASKQYVNDVTSGRISRDRFGHDGKGFGLYQLTYFSRKLGYYDFWKQSGKPLDDAGLQCDYAIKELKTDYPALYNFLCATDDVYSATSRICCEFERPYHNNVQARYEAALRIRKELDLSGVAVVSENVAIEGVSISENTTMKESLPYRPELIPATEYWPPRTIDKNMTGADVEVLQAVLKARGFLTTNPDGIFGSYLEEVVKQFQTAYKLDVDGVVGPKTWAKLLERA